MTIYGLSIAFAILGGILVTLGLPLSAVFSFFFAVAFFAWALYDEYDEESRSGR